MDFIALLREKAVTRSPNPLDHDGVKRRWEWQCADRIAELEAALTEIRGLLPIEHDNYSRRVLKVAANALEPG